MYILGINAYHGDAAAALIHDGRIVAAAEEERFNRVKHCAGFPAEAVRYCLNTAGIKLEDVAHIGVSRDPSAHLHKKVLFAASRAAKQIGGRGTRHAAVTTVEPGERVTGNGEGQSGGNGAKRGPGIFTQVKDRLNNAAKVRDLKDDLIRTLGVSKSSLRAQFHNVEHHRAHPQLFTCRLSNARRSSYRRLRRIHFHNVGTGRGTRSKF